MLPWEVKQVLAPERESPVALNMVIAQDTEYVLLDEPTNDLDIYHAGQSHEDRPAAVRRAGQDGNPGSPRDQLGRLLLRLHLRSSGRQGRQVRHCGGGNDQRNPVGALPGGLQDHDHRGPASVHLLLKPPSFQYFCRKGEPPHEEETPARSLPGPCPGPVSGGLRHRSRSTAPGGYGAPYRPQRPKGARRGSGPL